MISFFFDEYSLYEQTRLSKSKGIAEEDLDMIKQQLILLCQPSCSDDSLSFLCALIKCLLCTSWHRDKKGKKSSTRAIIRNQGQGSPHKENRIRRRYPLCYVPNSINHLGLNLVRHAAQKTCLLLFRKWRARPLINLEASHIGPW